MVSVPHPIPSLVNTDSADSQTWLNALNGIFTHAEVELIRQACAFAAPCYQGRVDLSGTPLLQHALGSASILLGLHLDHEAIAAAILHAVPDGLDDWKPVLTERFGHNVAALVDGIARMEHVRQFSEMRVDEGKEAAARQAENLRKMLLAMVEDIRVVLIKLAERTQTLRNLAHADAALQQQVAQETLNLFAPLANRLGIWQIKWELEDLSIRFLEPELYKKIARLLDEKRVERERYISEVIAILQQALHKAGIQAEISGRPKHIYSIIHKMRRKQRDFDQLYDVRAVRILVDNIEQCYAALSVVHELWPPIPQEFDDYIAKPKPNGYRSLHTAVLGPRRLPLEVQIRTQQMHYDSELGVAAHWRYKENKSRERGLDEKIAWLRQVLAWKADLANSGALQPLRDELQQERVYVLTPKGKVIDLPQGATPVDFAYALHTDLGHRTRGAKVDGNIVPLNYRLQTGQRVEILTVKQGGPSRDWINPQLGYLQSARARAQVRRWFAAQNLEASIAQGRALLERELHRIGVNEIKLEKLAQKLHYHKPEDLLAALGRGDITPHRVGLAILPQTSAPPKTTTGQQPAQTPRILIEGESNLTYQLARCCCPQTGDSIVGYVTRDRGITIHRRDCPCLQRVPEDRKNRLLDARWSA